MNPRQLSILSVAAIAIVVGAIWIGATRNPTVQQSPALYPALKGQLQKIDRLQIFKAGDRLGVDLTRDEHGWRVKERNDFRADDNKVNALLINLESARIAEEKTSNPENYAALNVQDLNAPNATGVRLEASGIEPSIKLIVGKQDPLTRSSYVRRQGEKTSWSINSQLDVSAEPTAWLQRDALNIAADRIQEAVTDIAGESRYSVAKAKRTDTNFDVAGIPKGREVNSIGAPNAIAQSLVNLQLDDVRPASELATDKPSAHTSIRTFDGLVIDVDGFAKDDKRWLIVKASFNADLAKRFASPAAPPTETKADATKPQVPPPTEDVAAQSKKISDEAAAINAKLGAWAIAVPSYKYDTLFKPIEQLLKKKS